MEIKPNLFIALMLLLLSGCTLLSHNSQPTAWLKPGVQITLPAPLLEHPIRRQQLLTATVNGKSDSLLTLMNADGKQLTLAGLSPLGIRLFKVTYSSKGIETEQSITLPQLPPASQVLADVMMSYWPINVWQPQLPKGWTLIDLGDKRRLSDADNQLVSEISYQIINNLREPVLINQHYFGYQIAIQPMEALI